MSTNKKALSSIFLTVLIDAIGYGILFPIIPRVLTDPTSASYILHGVNSNLGYYMLGAVTAIYPFMQFLAAPILGQLSDIYGRKKLLALSVFGTALGHFLFAIGIALKSFTLVFLGRLIDGITAGNFSIAQASIADISEPKERAKNFGIVFSAFGIGFIIGPLLGGVLADSNLVSWFSAQVPFWFAGLLAIINTLMILRFYPKTNQKLLLIKLTFSKSVSNIKKAIVSPVSKYLFLSWFFIQSGFAFYASFVATYYYEQFHVSERQVGFYFGVVGVGMIITQALIVPWISKRASSWKTVFISILLVSILLIGIPLLPKFNYIMVLALVLSVFIGLMFANFSAIISRTAPPEEQGEVMGISTSVQAIAATYPPLLAGFLAANFAVNIPLFVSGTFVFIGWLIYVIKSYKPKQVNA